MHLRKFFSEKYLFWFVLTALVILYSVFKSLQWYSGGGDNAFVAQLAHNIAHRGVPLSQVAAAIEEAFRVGFTQRAEDLCALPFHITGLKEMNYFHWHVYLILYVVAPLSFFFSSVKVLSFLTALSFVSLLGMVYWVLRRRQVSIGISLLTVLLVASHPVWDQGILGQLYIDRFFIGLGFLLVLLLNEFPENYRGISIVALLATLLSDRTGVAVGVILIGHAVLNYLFRGDSSRKKFQWPLVVLGCAAGLFSVIVIKLYIQHPSYASFASSMAPSAFLANLRVERFEKFLEFFLIINFAVFGTLGVLSWRYLLIALALMPANIMGDIGGAEKTGFLTHYHSVYFPILVWAVTDGIAKIYQSKTSQRWRVSLGAVICLFTLCLLSLQMRAENKIKIFPLASMSDELLKPWNQMAGYISNDPSESLQVVRQIQAAVPAGSSVSTTEFVMPWLMSQADLYYYPNALSDADYAVLPLSLEKNGPIFGGAMSYLGEAETRRQNVCLTKRINGEYDVAHFIQIGTYAVLKRLPTSSQKTRE